MYSFLSTGNLVGSSISDFLQTYVITQTQLDLTSTGTLPIGIFQLPNLYGGYYAFPSHFSIFFIPELILLILQYLTQSLILTVNISIFLVLVLTQITSFTLFKYITKSYSLALIGSTLFSFCSWFSTEIYWGHYILLFGAAFLPLAILQLEKTIKSPSRVSFTLFLLPVTVILLSSFEILYTLFLYTILRLSYELATRNKDYIKTFLKTVTAPTLILVAIFVPILAVILTFLNICGTNLSSSYNSVFELNLLNLLIPRYIIDISNKHLFDLSIFTLLFSALGLTQIKKHPKPILFLFFISTVFLLFSTIPNTTLSRVPFRNLIITNLALVAIGMYGLKAYTRYFKPAITFALLTFVFITSFTIFASNPLPQLTQAEQYLVTLDDQARVVIYPNIWAQSNYVAYMTGHEVIGQSAVEVRNYPYYSQYQLYLSESLQSLPYDLLQPNSTAAEHDIQYINVMTPLTGTKYMIINDVNATFLPLILSNTTYQIHTIFNDSILLQNTQYVPIAPLSNQMVAESVNQLLSAYYIILFTILLIIYEKKWYK